MTGIYLRARVVISMESSLQELRTFVLSFKCTSYFFKYVFRILKYQPVFKSKYSKTKIFKKLVLYFVFFNLVIITMRFSSTTPARDRIPARTNLLPGPPLLRKEGKFTRLDISL
jgi:hypothetical protein